MKQGRLLISVGWLLGIFLPLSVVAKEYYSMVSSADLAMTDIRWEGEEDAQGVRQWDYIIVGAGASGSILARRISDAGKSVLVLEAGEFRYTDPVVLTPNLPAVLNDLTIDPRYSETYALALGLDQFLTYSEGRLVGGGAAHNYLLAVRGTPSVFNLWASVSADARWNYNNLLPFMKLVETYTPNGTSANPAQRGSQGLISVTENPPLNSDPFLTAVATAGEVHYSNDYNDPTLGTTVTGAPQNFVTPTNPRRSYSALDYLPMTGPDRVINSHGTGVNGRKLQVLTNARVLWFNTDGQKSATSVDFIDSSGDDVLVRRACLKERGTLILAAGAINTPKILMQSGVGPKATLSALGIKTIVDSPVVGTNIQNHYGPVMVLAGFSPGGSAFLSGAPYVVPSDDGVRRIQTVINPSAPNGIFEILGTIVNPKSAGAVTLVDTDPLVKPKVTYDFYSDGDLTDATSDISVAVAFYKIIKAAATAVGATVLYPPPPDFSNDNILANDAMTNLGTFGLSDHIVRSTPMGTSISNGVVDSKLKVFGLKNVRIGDIGVMPNITDGNPCLPAYYIAEELAAILGFSGL